MISLISTGRAGLIRVQEKSYTWLLFYIWFYNIAFVNSERWLAKSRVDITLCQHEKFHAILLLKFFVLYYKRNIKHFFRIDIQLYQHSWKLEKLELEVGRRVSTQFLVFPISTRVDITVYQHGKCFIFLKYNPISFFANLSWDNTSSSKLILFYSL